MYGGGISKNELEVRLKALESKIRQLISSSMGGAASSTLVRRVASTVTDGLPSEFPPAPHGHPESDITDLDKYTQGEVDTLLADLTLANLSDVGVVGIRDGRALVYSEAGGKFVAGRPGVTYRTIPEDVRVEVLAGEQYIVYDELVVDGELFIDGGEVVVL
jgi:hypothetical protein